MDAKVNVEGLRIVIEDTGLVTATGTGVERITGKTGFVIDANVNVEGFTTVTVIDETGFVTATAIGVEMLTGNTEFVI